MNHSSPDLINTATSPYVSDTIDLYPRIVARIEKRSIQYRLKAHPAISILLALFFLFSLSSIVYAIGRSLGYIPGVGIVDKTEPLSNLANPLSLTRDGITLTIDQVIRSVDKTIILYTFENVPQDSFIFENADLACTNPPVIRLPDNTDLEIVSGSSTNNQNRFVFPAIKKEIDNITIVIPCIFNTLFGTTPRDWEVHLPLVPAIDLEVDEVLDIVQPTETNNQGDDLYVNQSSLKLEQVINIEDGYIFLLSFSDEILSDGSRITTESEELKITDNFGNPVFVSLVNDIDSLDITAPIDNSWAYKVISDSMKWPLTFEVQTKVISKLNTNTLFNFDTGPNPQPGQEWSIDEVIQIGGYRIEGISIQYNVGPEDSSYSFVFNTTPSLSSIGINIKGANPIASGGGLGKNGHYRVTKIFAGSAPVGKLDVLITSLSSTQDGSIHSVRWQPHNPPIDNQSLYGISPQLDQYVFYGDNYYLIGHIEWADVRIDQVFEDEPLSAFDNVGNKVTLEKVTSAEALIMFEELQDNQWVYRVPKNSFSDTLSLRLSQVRVVVKEPIQFSFDLFPYGFIFSDEHVGKTWKIGVTPISIPGLSANASQIIYIREGGYNGFRIGFGLDTHLKMIAFNFSEGVFNAQNSYRKNENYFDYQFGMGFIDVLTDGTITFPVTLLADSVIVTGDWESIWQLK